jgi:hypothetical protein
MLNASYILGGGPLSVPFFAAVPGAPALVRRPAADLDFFWVVPLGWTLFPAAGPEVVPFAWPACGDCCAKATPPIRRPTTAAPTNVCAMLMLFLPVGRAQLTFATTS